MVQHHETIQLHCKPLGIYTCATYNGALLNPKRKPRPILRHSVALASPDANGAQ